MELTTVVMFPIQILTPVFKAQPRLNTKRKKEKNIEAQEVIFDLFFQSKTKLILMCLAIIKIKEIKEKL